MCDVFTCKGPRGKKELSPCFGPKSFFHVWVESSHKFCQVRSSHDESFVTAYQATFLPSNILQSNLQYLIFIKRKDTVLVSV